MAERLKGISFVIGLDVSEFKANLKDVTDALKMAKSSVQTFKDYLKANPNDQNAYKGYIEALNKLKEIANNTKTDFSKLAEELLKTGNTTDGRFDQVVKDLKLLDGYLKTTIPNFDKFNERIKQTADGTYYLAEEMEDAQEQSNGFKQTMWATFVSGVLQKAISEVVSLAKSLADSFKELVATGVDYSIEMEKYTVAITAMLNGDAEAVDKLTSSMIELSSASSFDTSTLLEASQMLLAADVSAQNTTDTIQGLAKALAYAGKGNDELSRMAQNLQQIKNNGKASAADLKQFSNAGVNVLGLVSDMTGKATEELQKQGVTFEQISAALIKASEAGGKFENAILVQSSTINGQIQMMQSNFKQLASVITEDLTQDIKNDYLPTINEAIKQMKELYASGDVEGFKETFVTAVQQFVDDLQKNLPEYIQLLKDVVTTIMKALLTLDEEGHSILHDLIVEIVNAIIELLTDDEIMDLFGRLGAQLAIAIVDGLISGLFKLTTNVAGWIGDWIKKLSTGNLNGYDTNNGIYLRSGGFGIQSGGLTLTTNINVSNNGTPINETEIRKWGNTITDIVSTNLARRM